MGRLAVPLVAGLLVAGCGTTTITRYPALPQPLLRNQKVVVVIDGTSNDSRDRTNAARMHELISNQNRPNLSVFYTEGVGSDGRVGGMATGWGMAKDVRDAYRFIAETWDPGDGGPRRAGEIYLFGFSRGAFAGRILTGLIDTAGVVDLRPDALGQHTFSPKQRKKLVDDLYDAYKAPKQSGGRAGAKPTPEERRAATDAVKLASDLKTTGTPRIAAVGYWDTVGAMGYPDGKIDPFGEEKDRYLDQFCNVDRVFHAVSLDDNRPRDFTPLLATGPKTVERCQGEDAAVRPEIEEVWFSGAHADVGGTYADELALQGHLPGVSLNWMLARLQNDATELLPSGAGLYANPYDMIHDAQRGLAVWRVRKRGARDVMSWVRGGNYNGGRPKIHVSVAQRLAVLYDIDAGYQAHCNKPRRKPALLCAADLAQSGPGDREPRSFLAALIRESCVVRMGRDGPTPDERSGGYAFVADGPPLPVNRMDARVRCVDIAFDTVGERDAYVARPQPSLAQGGGPAHARQGAALSPPSVRP